MHAHESGETVFHYNSDLSGDIIIQRPGDKTLTLPAKDLMDFVLSQVVNTVASRLMNLDIQEAWKVIQGFK